LRAAALITRFFGVGFNWNLLFPAVIRQHHTNREEFYKTKPPLCKKNGAVLAVRASAAYQEHSLLAEPMRIF
jgi:hypothetical protein